MSNKTKCGYVGLIGRPNVGKSTLLNQLLGQKISITSRKPQTTRHRILGIKSTPDAQIIFVDTPGIHLHPKHAINRLMISKAIEAIRDVDSIIFMVDARKWTEEDDYILNKLKFMSASVENPLILALNKVDMIKDKSCLLPIIKTLNEKLLTAGFSKFEIIPISATKKTNFEKLEKLILSYMPSGPYLFPEDQLTDKNERFLAAELIREKLTRFLGQEVPHALTVEIDEFKLKGEILHINANIWVERKGQKIIVVGQGGEVLKDIGRLARLDMEKMFEHKVFLRLWVKVKTGWTDNQQDLAKLGYDE